MTEKPPRRRESWLYIPLGSGFFLVLLVAGLLIVGLVAFDALSYAYQRIGISVEWMGIIMAAALLGSLVNIPVARLRVKVSEVSAPVTVFGVPYRVPLAVQTGRAAKPNASRAKITATLQFTLIWMPPTMPRDKVAPSRSCTARIGYPVPTSFLARSPGQNLPIRASVRYRLSSLRLGQSAARRPRVCRRGGRLVAGSGRRVRGGR